MDRLPNNEDIRALPKWARVAYASRCAGYVLPILLTELKFDSSHYLSLVRAISLLKDMADQTDSNIDTEDLSQDVHKAYIYASSLNNRAKLAAYAISIALASKEGHAAAVAKVASATELTCPFLKQHLISDYLSLLEYSQSHKLDDSTPVPSSAFDSTTMNLDDKYFGDEFNTKSHAANVDNKKLVVKAYLNSGADPDRVGENVVELYRSLNEYSLLKYGKGLTIEEFDQFVNTKALVPEGVS